MGLFGVWGFFSLFWKDEEKIGFWLRLSSGGDEGIYMNSSGRFRTSSILASCVPVSS